MRIEAAFCANDTVQQVRIQTIPVASIGHGLVDIDLRGGNYLWGGSGILRDDWSLRRFHWVGRRQVGLDPFDLRSGYVDITALISCAGIQTSVGTDQHAPLVPNRKA